MRGRRLVMLLLLWLLFSSPSAALAPAPQEPAWPRAYVGIWWTNDNWYGVAVVDRVDPNSPADVAGVQKGDVIVAVVWQDMVYSFAEALQKIPAQGVWTAPRWAYGPDERVVELIIRRSVSPTRSLFHNSPEDWERQFVTVVATVRWAARYP